jgi:hypothetical protein
LGGLRRGGARSLDRSLDAAPCADGHPASTQRSDHVAAADFKKAAAVEIERFKDEYRKRFPGRDADELTDEDLMREVMNTVGKPGRLGERIRCVVSVSMLTEGWDANTVTQARASSQIYITSR